jgi:outer membrane protein
MDDKLGKLGFVLLLCAGAALAQEHERGARFSVGAGIARTPLYPGSERYEPRVIPVLTVNFGRFFFGGESGGTGLPGGGVNIVRDEHWRAGVGLLIAGAFRKQREESDDASLRGMGDIERVLRGLAFVGYERDWYGLYARLATELRDKNQGTLVLVDALARRRVNERFTVDVGPGVTWADSEYMMTFFGVSAEQAARSALPQYRAQAGFYAIRFGAGGSYRIDRDWRVMLRASVARLEGDAAQSPITRDRMQYTVGVLAAYEF